jgi:hypothetical protein
MIRVDLDAEEMALFAILTDPTGIDQAEAFFLDEASDDGCYRLWAPQWGWYDSRDKMQVSCTARAVGKSWSIQLRALAFPFCHAGSEMSLVGPELNHLRLLTDPIENRFISNRLMLEMLQPTKSAGITRRPHWQANFSNGSVIRSRLPNKDGRGVKGLHSKCIELDEAQDFPLPGFTELIETFNMSQEGSVWRCHGVPRGVRDRFYELTQPESGFTVHRVTAMARPSWDAVERETKIATYGGSRSNPDYKRNILGEHGDSVNPVFVLARLMACTDTDQGSIYNTQVYHCLRLSGETLEFGSVDSFLATIPQSHFVGYSQLTARYLDDGTRLPPTETGSPHGYSAYFAGMDVGVTAHPSEITVFGQRTGSELLELLLRINMFRVDTDRQIEVVEKVFGRYGRKLLAFGMDMTGVGWPLWDLLSKRPAIGDRVHGYGFSTKVPVGLADPEELDGMPPARRIGRVAARVDERVIMRWMVEAATDLLRNDYIDAGKMRLPFDREVLLDFQGTNYRVIKVASDPYGKKEYGGGSFHALDAVRTMVAAKHFPAIQAMIDAEKQAPTFDPVVDLFGLD